MTRLLRRAGLATMAGPLLLGLGLTGCSANGQTATFHDRGVPLGSFQLVAFDTCQTAVQSLRAAAKAVVGPYGFGGGVYYGGEGALRGAAPPAPQAAGGAGGATDKSAGSANTGTAPDYSGTNRHEAGADEPDLVKTDGRRIVTITAGVLRVIDAASATVNGTLDLNSHDPNGGYLTLAADLLLSGDHALVLSPQNYAAMRGGVAVPPGVTVPEAGVPGGAVDDQAAVPRQAAPDTPAPIYGPRLILVDLAGRPRVLGEYTIDGGLVDARQVGPIARVVIRSNPRVAFPYQEKSTDAERLAANLKVIDRTPLADWLPRIEVSNGGTVEKGQAGCAAISRPATYTGTNMLTVLTFDLGADRLSNGDPTTIVADGETVYSNGPSLYIASDLSWRQVPMVKAGGVVRPDELRTEIYKFDTSGTGRPRYVAGGTVPGYLINQYAMSEWDGKLRVATTSTPTVFGTEDRGTSHSGVYVLEVSRRALREIGHVDGLGKGERIYAVRFYGTQGYVVTFRQMDPLYTVDLSDPTHPKVLGELKITGYSSYLHPAGAGRLIGIGQEATERGAATGTQISLFDTTNQAAPKRLARYQVTGSSSEAEFDPHAFLYWPRDGLLVVPLQVYGGPGGSGGGSAPGVPGGAVSSPVKAMPNQGALVLRIGETGISEVGFISHPWVQANAGYGYPAQIRRSLIIDQTLWTLSDAGLMANDTHSLDRIAWIPLG
ncbi:MAG: beta-propeller domain-containing protein [Micromonosporaceae bacterium]